MYNKQCSAAAAAAAAEWLDTMSFAKDHCGCHCWILIRGGQSQMWQQLVLSQAWCGQHLCQCKPGVTAEQRDEEEVITDSGCCTSSPKDPNVCLFLLRKKCKNASSQQTSSTLNAAAHHWVRTPMLLPSLADTDVGPRRITFYREKVIWGGKIRGESAQNKRKRSPRYW